MNVPEPATDRLRDVPQHGRFELWRNETLLGTMLYTKLKPNRYALRHTEVSAGHQHQGVGADLIDLVLREVRSRGGTVTAICPFVAGFLSGHPEWRKVVDARHPGYPDRATAEAAQVEDEARTM